LKQELAVRRRSAMATCGCGCGETTVVGLFRPAHDQQLRTQTEKRARGLVALARIVDAVEEFARGRLSLDAFGARVLSHFPR